MKAKSVRVYNLIPFLSGRADAIKRHEGRPEKVLQAIRAACEQRERSLGAWAQAIERHCPIPCSHPYRRYADRLPEGDALRTLGCWAYGAGNSWITIDEITWEDGSVNRPQDEHRAWLKRQSAILFSGKRAAEPSGPERIARGARKLGSLARRG